MSDRVTALLDQYARQLALPWRQDLSGAERVWIAVYPPELERRIRFRLGEFELATTAAGKGWRHIDLTDSFGKWLAAQEYREAYFEEPGLIAPALEGYEQELLERVRAALTDNETDDKTVVALSGVGSLFPMVRVSELIQKSAQHIRGRLLVLFPGSFEHGNYRLLEARDGWNYLAVPITIPEGAR
jgi:hypothetical protein